MIERVKIVVEEHADGFLAYPLGIDGSVIGEGATAELALADARSALRFHVETFGKSVLPDDRVLDAFLAEDTISVE